MKALLVKLNTKVRSAISNEGFRKYFFNTGWMIAEKVLRLITAVFISAYVARFLGPDRYGLLNYAISLTGAISVFATLGLDNILVREVLTHKDRENEIMGTAFTLRIIAATLVFAILYFAVEATESDPTTKFLIYIIYGCAIVQVFLIIEYYFQAKVWSKYLVWSQLIGMTVSSIFKIVLIFKEASVEWFAATYLIDAVAVSIGLIAFYKAKGFSLFSWKFNPAIAKQLLRDSWPMILSGMAISIYMKFDQLMIKWMLGNSATGNYGVAVRLTEMWQFVPAAIIRSVYPALVNAKNVDNVLFMNRLQKLYDFVVGIGLSIAIAMTFLSGFVVNILFGPDYAQGGNILSLYVWSCIFTYLGMASNCWVVIENLQKFKLWCLVAGGVVNVILNYFLINTVGLVGAAIATLISYAIADYFSLLALRQTRPMFGYLSKALNPFRLVRVLVAQIK